MSKAAKFTEEQKLEIALDLLQEKLAHAVCRRKRSGKGPRGEGKKTRDSPGVTTPITSRI